MDIDSLDLKNGILVVDCNTMSGNSRRCNRYSSGVGQSVVSDCGGLMTMRSNSNPGMEVLSEDFEDAVFEDIPQDIDEACMPCLSHTYARSASASSPPSSPNVNEIGSNSSLLSNNSSGPMLPYSQMASSSRQPQQRLSSSGSDTSGVDYHTMSNQGLAPITNSKKKGSGQIPAYSQLSQIPPADVAVDLSEVSDEDNPEYNQMALREPMLPKPNMADNLSESPPEYHKLGLKEQVDKRNGIVSKSPSLSGTRFNDIPSIHIGSLVKPQKEIIVATAFMPNGEIPSAETKSPATLDVDPCEEAEPCGENNRDVAVPEDDHSYSIVAAGKDKSQAVKPSQLPSSTRPNGTCPSNSAYVPNGCLPNSNLQNGGFTIPNGAPPAQTNSNIGVGGGSIPIPQSTCSINEGYVPNNSPPSCFAPSPPLQQSTNIANPTTNNNHGKTLDGYAPATPQAMAAIVNGRPLCNGGYVPNTAVV